MEKFPHPINTGLTAREQYRQGRRELLTTSFETIERNVRLQLQGLLGPGGFDAAKDIAGITVNRWAHGYAYYIILSTMRRIIGMMMSDILT